MKKMLLCCVAVACLTTLALADNNDDLNFSLTMDCNSGQYCFADPGFQGSPATASGDFSVIGAPFTFNTTTGEAIEWGQDGKDYFATFGYGGTFQMAGPDGLTFTGVVTSGSAEFSPGSWSVQVDYQGEWSNGVFASGDAFVQINNGGQDTQATLDSQVAPEPSTFLLVGTGVVEIALRRRLF